MNQVYLAFENKEGRYKIGVSKNPDKRLKQLQVGNSEQIILVHTYYSEYAYKIEKALHRSYKKIQGEWYYLSMDEVSQFLFNCNKIHSSLKMLELNKI